MKVLTEILCFIGFHKSDEKYDSAFFGIFTFSHCVHCGKRVYHKKRPPRKKN